MPKGDRVLLARTVFTVKDEQLKAMPARVERAMQDGIFQLGRRARDMARKLAPKRTGALAASIYVSRGAEAGKSGGSPFTKQSTIGYFRAINAAIRRNPRVERLDEELGVHSRTQRPLVGSNFKSSIDRINGINYTSYTRGAVSVGETDIGNRVSTEFITPTITPLGAAGRRSFFVTVGAGVHYAADVEFGHDVPGGGRVPPRPFLAPAMEWAAGQLPEVAKTAMEKGLKK